MEARAYKRHGHSSSSFSLGWGLWPPDGSGIDMVNEEVAVNEQQPTFKMLVKIEHFPDPLCLLADRHELTPSGCREQVFIKQKYAKVFGISET